METTIPSGVRTPMLENQMEREWKTKRKLGVFVGPRGCSL